MHVCCLDLEGVLLPEVWIEVARRTKIERLSLTTRDIPDYDELMRYRLKILKKEGIKLKDIQKVVGQMRPLPGAKTFLQQLQREHPVVILSDTYYEFIAPLIRKIGSPTLFCNWLKVGRSGAINGYVLRQPDGHGKRDAVKGFQKMGFKVRASGDSYNDMEMLQAADKGILYRPPTTIQREYPYLPVTRTYSSLLRLLTK